MNTTTILLVGAALVAVLCLRNGSFSAAGAAPGWYGTPAPPGPPVNGMTPTRPNPVNASGSGSKLAQGVNGAFALGAKVDQSVVTGVCTYYSYGAGTPVCSKVGKAVSDFNEFQRKTTIKVATKGAGYIANAAGSVAHTIGGWF